MNKNINLKFLFLGLVIGILIYILPIIMFKPENHIIAYIYDPDIIELYKQKKLKIKEKLGVNSKVKVENINIDESINGMEII